MKRREFIGGLGSAAAWPLAARAQQGIRMRRIGVLMAFASDDPEGLVRVGAFLQGLQELGWALGRNVQIDYRWASDGERIRTYAAELVALAPDVFLATGAIAVRALQQATRTLPIVFVGVTDPVGAGHVESLARPGRNATGFTLFEYGMSAKWLELLKQIAPQVTRVAVLRDPNNPTGIGQFAAIQPVASSFRVELRPIDPRDASEIERAIAAFAREANSGLIVLSGGLAIVHRGLIITLAALYRLPAVYPSRYFVADRGLISYGPNSIDPTAAPPATLIASSRVRNRQTCRYRHRPSMRPCST
jgi:putative ABC transport system substrate-binding protein